MATGFGFTSIVSMHSARTFAAAVAWAGGTKVLVTGGTSADGQYSAELYDSATHSWTHSEMTTTRSHHTATLLKTGRVLVVGGDTSTDPGTAEVYDPNTNSWQKIFNNLHSPRNAHTATLLADGRVLVTGGLSSSAGPTLMTAEIFDPGDDPVNGSWTPVNTMNETRAFHTATLLPNGTVLVAGGTANTGGVGRVVGLSSAELFNPATGVWNETLPMNDGHFGHTATLLSSRIVEDFQVLVAGGLDSLGDGARTTELYKPPPLVVVRTAAAETSAGGSWVLVGLMNVHRQFHTATSLPPSRPLAAASQVLVAGGAIPGDEMTTGQTTELFDLATGIWTLTGNMNSHRTGHIAELVAGGGVLLAGGAEFNSGTNGPTQTAELGAGCDANAEIVVSPEQTLNFGQVHAGSEFNNANFMPTVQNTGNALLTLTASITGPDAALFRGGETFTIMQSGVGSCISGPTASSSQPQPVFVQFYARSPVPKTCNATLTLSGSNATNVPAGKTWVFPMTAEIILSPSDVAIEITAPSFPGEVVVGDSRTGQLVITLTFQVSEAIFAIVRVPQPPPNSQFHWAGGDYILGEDSGVLSVSIPVEFRPLGPGSVTQTLELVSNAQGSPHLVHLQGTGRKGIVP